MVEDHPEPAQGSLHDWVIKDERHRRMHVARDGQGGAKEARLSYKTLHLQGNRSLLEVALQTGRKHQIRVQLAAMGAPIVGDMKYSKTQPLPDRSIALLAKALVFRHPVRKDEEMRIETDWV